MLNEHIYSKMPSFYFCNVHMHRHKSHPDIDCIIREVKCCDAATCVVDYNKSFVITATVPNKKNGKMEATKFIIFDAQVWCKQSLNHFMSFVRAVIEKPTAAAERYTSFEGSSFTCKNIPKQCSGKSSLPRTAINGYETTSTHQTSTISPRLHYGLVMLPQSSTELLRAYGFDLSTYIMVKRDPSLLQTCMYVVIMMANPNPDIKVATIPDQLSKGMNQDQDGDKNGFYLLRKHINGYDCLKGFEAKAARVELAKAFLCKRTLVAGPRLRLSENGRYDIWRFADEFMHIEFFRRTYKRGYAFMDEAATGYLSAEYDAFQEALMQHNRDFVEHSITIDDLISDKDDRLKDIYLSGSKGDSYQLKEFLDSIQPKHVASLKDKIPEALSYYNKCVTSSQALSVNGREQFAALYGAHDLVVFFSDIWHNKKLIADYSKYACCAVLLWSEASITLFMEDLEAD